MDVLLKNTANTGLLCWDGRLFALMEAGQPHELDPATLDTIGVSLFNSTLKPGVPFEIAGPHTLQDNAERALAWLRKRRGLDPSEVQLGGDAMAAHFREDPVTGRLVTLSYRVLVRPQSSASNFKIGLIFWGG